MYEVCTGKPSQESQQKSKESINTVSASHIIGPLVKHWRIATRWSNTLSLKWFQSPEIARNSEYWDSGVVVNILNYFFDPYFEVLSIQNMAQTSSKLFFNFVNEIAIDNETASIRWDMFQSLLMNVLRTIQECVDISLLINLYQPFCYFKTINLCVSLSYKLSKEGMPMNLMFWQNSFRILKPGITGFWITCQVHKLLVIL